MEFLTGKRRTGTPIIIDSRRRGFSVPGLMRYPRPDPSLPGEVQIFEVCAAVHERWHQVQYREVGLVRALARLAAEQLRYARGENVYSYSLGRVERLSDIGHLEAQAQFVEHFAVLYLNLLRANGLVNTELRRRARILRDSGIRSPAVSAVLRARTGLLARPGGSC